MSSRRVPQGAAVVVAAALGVAVAVTAVSVLSDGREAPAASTSEPTSAPTVLGEDVLVIDRGVLGDAEAREACGTKGFAAGGPVEVLYAVTQLTAEAQQPVVVLRNAAGELRLCDAGGPDSPARAPLPTASPQDPVVVLSSGSAWDCTGDTLDRFTSDSWLAVDETVATVRARLLVDGDAGPWFTTSPVGGHAHLQLWQDGPLPSGTDLTLVHEVLDSDGAVTASGELPTEPSTVGWCEDGDVQIG